MNIKTVKTAPNCQTKLQLNPIVNHNSVLFNRVWFLVFLNNPSHSCSYLAAAET